MDIVVMVIVVVGFITIQIKMKCLSSGMHACICPTGNYGLTMIFFLSGLSLQTSDLTKVMSNVQLNTFIQTLIFGFWPFCIGLLVSSLLKTVVPNHILPTPLVDRILIMMTLPTTINMCIMLTSAGGRNVELSICNAVISNMAGILLTLLLLLHFFIASIQLPFGQMVLKLCQKVLLPVTAGQLLRTSTRAKELYQKHSKAFKQLQEVVLLGIIWNAFCNAFSDGLGIGLKESLFLLVVLPLLHISMLATFFKFFSLPALQFTRGDRIAAMFCASQKTLAFGLPLVNTIFQGNPNLAAFCAPIMFIHPLQMTMGSLLLPAIQKYTEGKGGKEEQQISLLKVKSLLFITWLILANFDSFVRNLYETSVPSALCVGIPSSLYAENIPSY
jgi:sodium/bile acid cotransporter 7